MFEDVSRVGECVRRRREGEKKFKEKEFYIYIILLNFLSDTCSLAKLGFAVDIL